MLTVVKGTSLSVIIPTYNERENLPLLVDMLSSILGKSIEYEIIIVDDNSPDGTGKVAEELKRKNGKTRVIHRPTKMGLASALIDGIKVSNGDLVVVSDADLQHSPAIFKIFSVNLK